MAAVRDERPLGPDHRAGIGGGCDHRVVSQRGIARQTEDIVDAMGFAPGHHLGPRIVTVTTHRDPGVWPMPADTADQAAHMAPDLLAGRGAGGAQDERDGPAGSGLVDMDRRVAALPVEPVPEGELLLAMGGVERVINIEGHRLRRGVMAGAVDVHHLPAQPDQGAGIGNVLPAATSSVDWPTRPPLPALCQAPS